MSIDQTITEMIETAVSEAIDHSDFVSSADLVSELSSAGYDLDDFVTTGNFDPSDYDLVTSDELPDMDDYVTHSDIPDFDDFVRQGDTDVESEVYNLLRQYNPTGGCSTAQAATEALSGFFYAILTGDLDEQHDVLIRFLADPDLTAKVDEARTQIKVERKAAKAEAKKQAKREAKAERKAAKQKAKEESTELTVVPQLTEEQDAAIRDEAV